MINTKRLGVWFVLPLVLEHQIEDFAISLVNDDISMMLRHNPLGIDPRFRRHHIGVPTNLPNFDSKTRKYFLTIGFVPAEVLRIAVKHHAKKAKKASLLWIEDVRSFDQFG